MISRNVSARILISLEKCRPSFFPSFFSPVPFFFRTSGAGVRRMRQMVETVWLVHSWKFSSWRRDALEGALVPFDEYPGEATTKPVAYPAVTGGWKKVRGSRRSESEYARNSFPPFTGNSACERCNWYASRGNYMAWLLFGTFWFAKSIETARALPLGTCFQSTARNNMHVVCGVHFAASAKRSNLPRRIRVKRFVLIDESEDNRQSIILISRKKELMLIY